MGTAVKSLWSTQIKPDILSPKQILNAQASALAEMTGGVLLGELVEGNEGNKQVVLTLNMFAPTMNYRQQVLVARHDPTLLYPVTLDAEVFRPKGLRGVGPALDLFSGKKSESQADSDEELVKLVEKVLQSSEVVSLALSLIALSNEARVPTDYLQYLRKLSDPERQSAIDAKIADTCHEILDSEAFTSVLAETNASGWGVDEYEIDDIELTDGECLVKISYSATGEQEEEKMSAGDKITGTAEAVIDQKGSVEYGEITAEVEHDSEVEEPEAE